jgi:hypothetical protein
LLRVWLLADRTWAFRRLPGNKHRRFRVGDVLLLTEERDRRQGERAPFAAQCESLPIEREYRSVAKPHERLSERVFTCLYREGRRGVVREPEGIENVTTRKVLGKILVKNAKNRTFAM